MNKTGLGVNLKNARESMSLSIKDVSERLRLNAKFITLLENEDFSQQIPLTFLRGYLRSYARLLNFSEEAVQNSLLQLNEAVPADSKSSALASHAEIPKTERYHRWITYLVIAVLLGLVTLWWQSHPAGKPVNSAPAIGLPPPVPPITSTVTAPVAVPAPPVQANSISEKPAVPAVLPPPKPAPLKMAQPEEPGLEFNQ